MQVGLTQHGVGLFPLPGRVLGGSGAEPGAREERRYGERTCIGAEGLSSASDGKSEALLDLSDPCPFSRAANLSSNSRAEHSSLVMQAVDVLHVGCSLPGRC
jgi:hypothetical protein